MTIILLFLLSLPCMGGVQAPYLEFSRGTFFMGPALTYSKRAGYIDFENLKKSQAVGRNDLFTLGLSGGFRVPLTGLLRFQIGLAIDGGSATDDTLFAAQTSLVKNYYYHASLEPALHCALVPAGNRVTPFLILGAGVNVVWVNEHTFFKDDPGQEVIYTDRYYVNNLSWSVSGTAGLGIDIGINPWLTISLTTSFRFLYPVSYEIKEDLPLYSMHYTETLYGNVTWAGVVFSIK